MDNKTGFNKSFPFTQLPTLILLLWLTLAGFLGLLLYDTYLKDLPFMGEASETEIVLGCGTMDTPYGNLDSIQQAGKQLFRANCAACHAGDMVTPLTGPALAEGIAHWTIYPRKDLYVFIRNSQEMISQGHPRAVEIWEEWQPVIMNNFELLSDEDIQAILAYIERMSNKRFVFRP